MSKEQIVEQLVAQRDELARRLGVADPSQLFYDGGTWWYFEKDQWRKVDWTVQMPCADANG